MIRSLSRIAGSLADASVGGLAETVTGSMGETFRVAGSAAIVTGQGRTQHVHTTYGPLKGMLLLETETGRGPSLDARTRKAVVAIADLRKHREAWPEVVDLATGTGITSLACVHFEGVAAAGALLLCDTTVRSWQPDELRALIVVADTAAAYLSLLVQLEIAREEGSALRHALETRIVIEQAKGMVAGKLGVTMERALRLLRRHARDRGYSLHAAATEVVTGRLDL